MKYTVIVDGDVFEIEIAPGGRAWVNQEPYEVDLQHVGGNRSTQSPGDYSLLMNHRSYEIHVSDTDNGDRWLTVAGRLYQARLECGHGGRCRTGDRGGTKTCSGVEADGSPEAASHTEVRAPLPGLVVELRVRQDQRVVEQQVVAVVESMKMNLEVRAPRGGTVRDLFVAPGRQVAQDEVLAVLVSDDGSCSD